MQVGLLSDTHGFLDEAIFTYFEKCDEVWHAGDFGPAVLDRLKTFKPVRGVFGNVDGAEIRAEFPQDLEWQCEGVRVYMTHIGGIRVVTMHVRSARYPNASRICSYAGIHTSPASCAIRN
jgi:predicted phosphodiesterase